MTREAPGRTLNARDAQWNRNFNALKKYVIDHHGEYPPKRDSSKLGRWITNQREAYKQTKNSKRKSLSKDQIEKLQSLRGWTWNAKDYDAQWNRNFNALRDYLVDHDGEYPSRGDSSGLGTWIGNQRQAYKQPQSTKRRSLSKDKIKNLESLPGWTWNAQDYDAQWTRNFNALKEHLIDHDGEYPPKSDPSKLGTWIDRQRQAYNRTDNTKIKPLSKDKIKNLESLPGWTWNAQDYDAQWTRNFNALKEHLIDHDGEYPTRDDSSVLYSWITTQRKAYNRTENTKLKPLSDDQIENLQSLRGWTWNAKDYDAQWNRNFNALRDYLVDHDGEYPTRGDSSGLGRWITTQRQAFKQPKSTTLKPLSDDKIEKLQSLRGWTWNGQDYDAQWNRNFNDLKEHLVDHDGEYPSRGDSSGLVTWIDRQRLAYNHPENTTSKPLSGDQINKLESLSGWTWNPRDAQWNATFNALKEYLRTHQGKYPKDKDPSGLGCWIHKQRQACKQAKKTKRKPLLEDRIRKLESLPGWTWTGRFN